MSFILFMPSGDGIFLYVADSSDVIFAEAILYFLGSFPACSYFCVLGPALALSFPAFDERFKPSGFRSIIRGDAPPTPPPGRCCCFVSSELPMF